MQTLTAAEVMEKVNQDCSFLVGSIAPQIIPGNKEALCRESPVLKDILEDGTFKTTAGHVRLSHIEPQIFVHLSCFVYMKMLPMPGSVPVMTIVMLMVTARSFQMPRLWTVCEDYICTQIKLENILPLLMECPRIRSEKIKQKLIQVFGVNAPYLFQTADFVHLPASLLTEILQEDKLNVASELQVIHAYVKWVIFQCEMDGKPVTDATIRSKLVRNFMRHFRFLSLSPQEFFQSIVKCGWLTYKERLTMISQIMNPEDNAESPVRGGSRITKKRAITEIMFLELNFLTGPPRENEADSIYKHAVVFNSDLVIRGIICHNQVDPPGQAPNNGSALNLANRYEEDISVVLSKENISTFNMQYRRDYYSETLVYKHFQGQSLFSSKIRFDFALKVKKNEVLFIYIICRKRGFYPMCTDLTSAQINQLNISMHKPSNEFNQPSPWAGITLYLP